MKGNDLAESAAPIVIRCWRCDHRIFDIEVEAERRIPPGVAVRRKCEKCKAINRIPLDKLPPSPYASKERVIE